MKIYKYQAIRELERAEIHKQTECKNTFKLYWKTLKANKKKSSLFLKLQKIFSKLQ